jgi:acyl-CoA synthetase (AMP-forming)/AMP-acid ligase II
MTETLPIAGNIDFGYMFGYSEHFALRGRILSPSKCRNVLFRQNSATSIVMFYFFLLILDVPEFSIGKVFPEVELQIRDADTGTVLGPHEKGEICIKTSSVLKGYFGNEKVKILKL